MGDADPVRAVEWTGSSLRILDQTRLPAEEVVIEALTAEDVAAAIRRLAVRGAPLLGIAAGYGMALAAVRSAGGAPDVVGDLDRAGTVLVASRPTAANIAWAVGRVLSAARAADDRDREGEGVRAVAVREATAIAAEDEASCRAIGVLGAGLLPHTGNVLTHCNTGALATGGWGTAQGVIMAAVASGKRLHVWVDETRPVLQGARLTAWELQRAGVPMTLVADTAAGSLMARGLVDAVIVGADRIAANGDVANKVGTYQLAVLAGYHGVPFYVAAPFSSIDLTLATGGDIVIEEREPNEVLAPHGVAVAPAGTPVANPAFDVTPAELVTALVTDRGVATPPLPAALARLRGAPGSIVESSPLREVS
jgi:methylthioribose-1-phosphate isomerase